MTPKTDQPPAHDDDVIASLRALPPRAPVEPAQARERVQWILVDLDRYAVSVDGRTVGFIDVVGAVFVALGGARYDQAVEIVQTLRFEHAVDTLAKTEAA